MFPRPFVKLCDCPVPSGTDRAVVLGPGATLWLGMTGFLKGRGQEGRLPSEAKWT